MAVQVGRYQKPTSAVAGEKQVADAAGSKADGDKGIFSRLLDGMKGMNGDSGGQKTATPGLPRRPPTSMITNPEHHVETVKTGQAQQAQNINNMAASALISLSAVSGQNRLSGLYSMGAGISPGGVSQARPASAGDVSTSNSSQGIGALSAQFESGEKGPEIIGYDPRGGTSYGTYQISSRAGTMRQFIDYLSEKAPDWAARLNAAGSANTGGRRGRMPEVWKKIAAEDPAKFSQLQYNFIEKTHYLPALEEIAERTGVDIGQSPKALKEVLWSTAVQHGPKGAAKIFSRAIGRSQAKSGGIQAAQLIRGVYNMRADQFGSSDPGVRAAVRSRFKQEGKIALAMLSEPFAPDTARA